MLASLIGLRYHGTVLFEPFNMKAYVPRGDLLCITQNLNLFISVFYKSNLAIHNITALPFWTVRHTFFSFSPFPIYCVSSGHYLLLNIKVLQQKMVIIISKEFQQKQAEVGVGQN